MRVKTNAKCGGLSTARQTIKLSVASVEMTLLLGGRDAAFLGRRDDAFLGSRDDVFLGK
jgi:hypothetical protein